MKKAAPRRMREQFVECVEDMSRRGLFRSFYFVNLSCWIQYNFRFNADDQSGLVKLMHSFYYKLLVGSIKKKLAL